MIQCNVIKGLVHVAHLEKDKYRYTNHQLVDSILALWWVYLVCAVETPLEN